ncbi:MAG: histidine kinase [Ruminococcaceae bacterium]|nr:histidine kinase [Oscillospiraceae bacterium]
MANCLRGLKLTQRFTLVILAVVSVPTVILALVLFGNMQDVIIEDKVKAVETSLLETHANVEKAAELCVLTGQFFLNSPNLTSFLVRAQSGDAFTTAELVAFYRDDIGGLERLVNANPYLYRVRVYHPNENVPELMPILYHESRMRRLAWADSWTSGAWQMDYTDAVFLAEAMKPTPHIMSLVTAIEDPALGRLGVLEVAVRMDDVMPGLYTGTDTHSALITPDALYCGPQADAFWQEQGAAVAALLPDGPGVHTIGARLGGQEVLVSAIAVDVLGGHYVSVVSLGELSGGIATRRNLFLLGTALILVLVVVAVHLLVKAMLRRFYRIVNTVAQVREGQLSVKVPDVGSDEIGALGGQINEMLDRIQDLMRENVERQLLAKNAEIKAMQSQINAHFIYNVLESIKMMAEVDGRYDIADAITSLGQMLRYSMRWGAPLATLAQELDNARNYLALINLRYDHQITLDCQVPPELLALPLPKMSLQPIVENAVVHGLADADADSVITLRAEQDGADAFLLEVRDAGRGMPGEALDALRQHLRGEVEPEAAPAPGIGLKNVADRITMTFGPGYYLDVDARPGSYTTVTLRLPLDGLPLDGLPLDGLPLDGKEATPL